MLFRKKTDRETPFFLPRRSSRPPEEINQICDAVRAELEKRDLTLYVQSILTAHVVKSPPDLEAALGLLARLQGKSHLMPKRHLLSRSSSSSSSTSGIQCS